MSGFNQVTIGGYPGGGLTTDRKPLMLADEAFSRLDNAYVWRYRVKKREGTVGLDRLQRNIPEVNFFKSLASPYTLNFLTLTGEISNATVGANPGTITTFNPHNLLTGNRVIITGVTGATGYNNVESSITVIDAFTFTVDDIDATLFPAYISGGIFASNRRRFNVETYANIKPGSVVYTIVDAPDRVLTDDGNGNLVSNIVGSSGVINYDSGVVTITTNVPAGADTLLQYSYYPALPVMGILKQDITTVGIDNTIFFDTTYAYQFTGGAFQELVSATPTIWTGNETQFFWGANWQGTDPSVRLFFVTNNNINDPIRYYNNTTWTDLTPIIADNPPSSAQSLLFQALIIIPYYGRLLALNTWEGLTAGGSGSASNFFARCRFSQIGDPTQADAWRSDVFGKGGFLDAPTNESIVSAAFFRNTLIVFFEYSTWQLRYIGEYGLPFIFERVSSDFGSSSTYSSIIHDRGVWNISDRGVIEASASGVNRIDESIPGEAFSFKITESAPNFVHGARDFEKELIYWNYLDTSTAATTQEWPNTTLVYNYINKTWAKFRDTITCFGPMQLQFGITWDSTVTMWDDENVSWDTPDDQNQTNYVAAGNQQGFVVIYEDQNAMGVAPSVTNFAPTLFIFGVNTVVRPTRFTIPNHNFFPGEIIYLSGLLWSGDDPELNDTIYKVQIVDVNTVQLRYYKNGVWLYVDVNSSLTVYVGGGLVSLLPKINITGKDFNPYQSQGKQFKVSYIDFQMDNNQMMPSVPAVTIQLFVNSNNAAQANTKGNNELLVNSSFTSGFIKNASQDDPCVINSPNHSLQTSESIRVQNVVGMTQLNGGIYNITVIDANNFSLDGVDATVFSPYLRGGIYTAYNFLDYPYQNPSEYAWYRFYSTQFGQYLRVNITYDDQLMAQIATHQSSLELNAMNFFFRPGGNIVN